MNIPFIKYRRLYYIFSGAMILSSIFALAFFGLKFGIDFTGGSISEVEFLEGRPSSQEIQNKLADLNLGQISIQPTGEKGAILIMRDLDETTHQEILKKIGNVQEHRFESIGPVVGKELRQKTWTFASLALLGIIFYIAFAFRKISWPLPAWQYGLITASVALFHDLVIPLGIFAVLGKIQQVQITIPIVVGLLTVLGYSVHDTIIVFDRIRENLLKGREKNFEDTVNASLNQTLLRSLSTSLTVLFVLFALFIFGGESLRYFSLGLILGVSFGTYSSIFIASPLLVSWYLFLQRRG